MKRIAIVGAGGMARDALHTLDALGLGGRIAGFFESPDVWTEREVGGLKVRPLAAIDAATMDILIAIGSGAARELVVHALPTDARYPTFVHPSVSVGRNVEIGAGSLVCAGSILTCDIRIGAHVQLNIATLVTHDCVLEDFATTAPGVRISGNCRLGRRAYVGTSACIRERTRIGDDVTVGMGAVVVNDLDAGTWVGNPARRLR